MHSKQRMPLGQARIASHRVESSQESRTLQVLEQSQLPK